METLWIEVAKQIPALVGLGFVVKWFLSFMKDKDNQHLTYLTKRDDKLANAIEKVGTESAKVATLAHDALHQNAAELGRSREATDRLTRVLERQEGLGGNGR